MAQLLKVKLLRGFVNALALNESLKSCKKLEELVIHFNGLYSREVEQILLEEHPWDLKRLVLRGVDPQSNTNLDNITKKLPNLERLEINLQLISDDGMEWLGKNCPKLRILQFESGGNLTDSGLDRLTKHLPTSKRFAFF